VRARGLAHAGLAALRLPAADRRRAFEALMELTRASLELQLLPSARTVGLLGTIADGEATDSAAGAQLQEATLVGRAVARVAGRLPWQPTCLRQALAAQRMLRRRDIPARLHLGVTSATEARAHAWVTVAGQPVIGGNGVERFVPLAAFG
jgi:hypothetical protein